MDFTPGQIARQTFPLMSNGFDPQAVGRYLESLAEHVHRLESELGRANALVTQLQAAVDTAARKDEALTLTMETAAKERREIIAAARQEAGQMIRIAKTEAARIEDTTAEIRECAETEAAETRAAAAAEARSMVQEARRQSLEVMTESRAAATGAAQASQREERVLRSRIEELRAALEAVEGPLRALASSAVADLAAVRDRFPEVEESRPAPRAREGLSMTAEDFDVVHRPHEEVAVSVGANTLTVAQLEYIEQTTAEIESEEPVPVVVEEVQREVLGVPGRVATPEERRQYLDALRQVN